MAIDAVFRDEWARVLASLIGFLGDFDLAEEATQEAFVIAAERWPRDGQPDNPGAWLTTTARNRAIDRLRRDKRLAATTRRLAALAERSADPEVGAMPDDAPAFADERLELIFTCCHPALADEAQVALTLRTLGGLRTEEIARAFLVSRETMKRRLTRAKTKIQESGIQFRVPPPELLPERTAVVLSVLYLVFNAGYAGRGDLAAEAIRLTRVLALLLPAEPEVDGLLSLMLLHDARRDARFRPPRALGDGSGANGSVGDLVLLADQDRSRWDADRLAEGRARLDRAVAAGGRGPYVVQAAIVSLQMEDPPDWVEIAALYARLVELTGSPVAELNRMVAVAETEGPDVALRILDRTPGLDDYQYFHSTRADLLRRVGRRDEARTAYARALALAGDDAERRFLAGRLAEL